MKNWNEEFTPSYTPLEMLEMGVFMDCHYNVAIEDLPNSWYSHSNVTPRNVKPDATKNYYGVKSRQSLKTWQENGWTTDLSPLGWWEWYVKYFYGRRDDKEDKLQISRWKSFVARHNAQVQSKCKKGDKSCNTKQRQGLLQWAWDSDTKFTQTQRNKNLERMLKVNVRSLKW